MAFTAILYSVLKTKKTKMPSSKITNNVTFLGHFVCSGNSHNNGYLSVSPHCEPNTTVSMLLIHTTNSPQ